MSKYILVYAHMFDLSVDLPAYLTHEREKVEEEDAFSHAGVVQRDIARDRRVGKWFLGKVRCTRGVHRGRPNLRRGLTVSE